MKRTFLVRLVSAGSFVSATVLVACVQQAPAYSGRAAFSSIHAPLPSSDEILLGRSLVLNHHCSGCHGGASPNSPDWLAGMTRPDQEFLIGPCAQKPDAQPCWRTRPRNLTPDNATGIGRFTERQLFNALRYGLRPEDTPDVDITSGTPGKGNFPLHPRYLAPPMPWAGWRYMSDREIMAIAAYLKRAVKPVPNKVAESEGPPDFWASVYTVDNIGPYPPTPFPGTNEHVPK